MTSAVLVIDVQQALCRGAYAAFDAAGVICRINAMTDRARASEVPVIFIQHESTSELLAHGSPGWQLADGLTALPTDQYLRKAATDSFHHTPLHAMLIAKGVNHLVVCGLQSEFCVDTTTRRALALGFPVTLVSDGHSTMDNAVLSAAQITQHHNLTLANISSFGVRAATVLAADLWFPA